MLYHSNCWWASRNARLKREYQLLDAYTSYANKILKMTSKQYYYSYAKTNS